MNKMSGVGLLARLKACPKGDAGWREFEDSCIATLTYLFVPPLVAPRIQVKRYSGFDRRDAVFANRNFSDSDTWGKLHKELNARMILFEFKNYNRTQIGKDDIDQLNGYMTQPMGNLAILCGNKIPNESAHRKRNSIYSSDKRVILFITPKDLENMVYRKIRGEDPADEIIDMVELFYLQHE
jgi:hypothetical protein